MPLVYFLGPFLYVSAGQLLVSVNVGPCSWIRVGSQLTAESSVVCIHAAGAVTATSVGLLCHTGLVRGRGLDWWVTELLLFWCFSFFPFSSVHCLRSPSPGSQNPSVFQASGISPLLVLSEMRFFFLEHVLRCHVDDISSWWYLRET